MKYCPGCATALENNIRKCPQCGYIFENVEPEKAAVQSPEYINPVTTTSNNNDQIEQPPIYIGSPESAQSSGNNPAPAKSIPKWKILLPLFISIGIVGALLQKCINTAVMSGFVDSDVVVTEEETETNQINRKQRNGFDSSKNKIIKLANYEFELPSYWEEDVSQMIDEPDSQKHVTKTEDSDSFVRFSYYVRDDKDNENIKLVIKNKPYVVDLIVDKEVDPDPVVLKQEVMTFGDATGLLTVVEADVIKNDTSYRVRYYNFMFASDEKLVTIMLTVSDNAKYEYNEDFVNALKSLRKIGES